MDKKEVKIDLKELKKDAKKNKRERLKFVEFWANYIKKHSDEKWSEQQNTLINSQLPD